MGDTEFLKAAKRFRDACTRRSGDGRLKKLKRDWDRCSHGDQAQRARVLHRYEAYAAQLLQPRADSVPVDYKPSGFCAYKGVADAITKPLRPAIDLRMVEKPCRRGASWIISGLTRVLLDGVQYKGGPLYVSNHEDCPLRPMLLGYGEHEQTAQLRSKCNLDPKDVFVLGLSGSGASEAHCPYASLFVFSGRACITIHLI